METFLDTPLGRIVLIATDAGLTHACFADSAKRPAAPNGGGGRRARQHLARARQALREYFAGRPTKRAGPVLAPSGTPFQKRVWGALRRVPYGETTSYGAIARRIGRPRAARAVGLANARNPIAILIPCHRVIGGDGSLTGYASGLERKAWLLQREGALGTPAGSPGAVRCRPRRAPPSRRQGAEAGGPPGLP